MAIIIWFTGLSGSGKTTTASELHKYLMNRGKMVEIIDGDVIRAEHHKELGFSREDIRTNNRLVAELCQRKQDQVDFILVPIISPYIADRKLAREIIGDNFIELYISCPIKKCIERDVKGLYKKALSGKINNFIGVHDSNPYEPPNNPEIIVPTSSYTVKESLNIIIEKLRGLGVLND